MNTNHLFDDLETLSDLEVDSSTWRALAERILASSEASMRIASRRASHQPHIVWERDRDDILQLVRMVHWRMLSEVGAGKVFAFPFEAWEAVLLTRARSAVRGWASAVEVTGISGYSGAARRQRAMHEVRERIEVDFGERLTDDEVAETYNDRIESDAGRRVHSAQAQAADLRGVSVVAGADLARLPSTESVERLVTDRLARTTTKTLVARTIEEASAKDAQLGVIAKAWLSSWPDKDLPSAAVVARTVGVPVARVRKALDRIRDICRGLQVAGGGDDATSLALARTVAEAWSTDDRLGRVAELRWSRWPERELVSAEEIARRLCRPRADVIRALAEIEQMLERHLVVEEVCDCWQEVAQVRR